jgi:Predicted membrane protein
MKKNSQSQSLVFKITQGAVIAALYTVLTLAIAPLGFGDIQLRISEILVILPLFTPVSIVGLTVGCLLTNFLGLVMGFNPLGFADMFFGTAATFIAAIFTWALRNVKIKSFPFFSFLPPIIFNALIIGAELHFILHLPFIISSFQVFVGEAISVFLFGIPLYFLLNKKSIKLAIFKN